MEYRNLGSSGLKVSIVGIGCNNFGRRCDAQQTAEVVTAALDNEINFFDTAVYQQNIDSPSPDFAQFYFEH